MWAALIVIAQVLGAPLPGGQEDFDLCRGMTKGTREESFAACHRVIEHEALGKKYIAAAYSMLARFSDNPAGAITNLDQAIALEPDTADYYEQRGFQFSLLNDNDRALADFEKGLALKPDDARIFFVRALTFKEMGEDARALADLDRAIALTPQEPTYYSVKAKIYLRQGKTAEALAMLDQGIAIKPDHAQFFQDRAEVYRKLGDAKGEEAALARLIALKPKEQYGILLRAFLYEKLGKPALAIADYDALLALDPNHNFYRERRAALLEMKAGAPAVPAPKIIDPAGDAPPAKRAAKGEPAKKADEAATELECRLYVPGAGVTVSVPCAK
jgi:tetratricopeptide (TPR) repeat protein